MTISQVEGILGKGAKEVSNDEVASLMKEAAGLGEGKLPGIKSEAPDLVGAKGLRWGDDSKSVTVIFINDRASRIFKKGF